MSKRKAVFLSLFVFSVALGIAFRVWEGFAELYTLRIAPIFRVPLSFVTSLFPFSVGESTVLLLIVLAGAALTSLLYKSIARLFKKDAECHYKTYFKIFFSIIAFIYFTYVFAFSSSYSRASISDTMGLEKVEMTKDSVFRAVMEVTEELQEISGEIEYVNGQPTRSGMSFGELAAEVLECADKASDRYPFFQKRPFKAKAIAFSTPMAYTGISGVYSFFTGESNVNTVFPEFTLPFTTAHEYSHQMGIGSEKEAEFSALLICLESNEPFIRYSAYSQVAITLMNLLFELDEEMFYECFSSLPSCLVNDIYLSSISGQKYSETYADEIAEAINDTYLSVSGDEGVVSYDLSSQLYVAYFLRS